MWIHKPGAKILEFGDQTILASANPASLGGFEVPGAVWLHDLRHKGWKIMNSDEDELWQVHAAVLDLARRSTTPAKAAPAKKAAPAAKAAPAKKAAPAAKAAPARKH